MTLQQIYDILDRALVADKNPAVEEALFELRQMPEIFRPFVEMVKDGGFIKTDDEIIFGWLDKKSVTQEQFDRARQVLE